MKTLLAGVLFIVASTIGCRSLPIAVPDLPPDQLLVNQPPFESALQQRIAAQCAAKENLNRVPQGQTLSRKALCEIQ